jgi:hypothetical protein
MCSPKEKMRLHQTDFGNNPLRRDLQTHNTVGSRAGRLACATRHLIKQFWWLPGS